MEFEFDGPSGILQIAFALLVGLSIVGYGAYSYTTQSAALDSAETVNATVVSTAIETISERRGTEYSPTATFNYTYEGETYTSSNVFPGRLPREFGSEADAKSQLSEYESGENVTAYVPPASPGNAFLKHESSNKPFLVIGVGGVFVLGTLVSVVRN